jgi:predicted nucleic acid-binding protein
MTLVVHASVALDWCFESERSTYANKILTRVVVEGAVVPFLWPAEVANGLVMAERKRKASEEDIDEALGLFESLAIQVDHPDSRRIRDLARLASKHRLTAYDAAYLDVALRFRLPLATLDAEMRVAAKAEGIDGP